jgi:hypothetical protein
LEISGEPLDEGAGEVGVVDVVDRAHDFLRMSLSADLTPRVTGFEEPEQLGPAAHVEAFVGLGKQASTAVTGVAFVASVPERLVAVAGDRHCSAVEQ